MWERGDLRWGEGENRVKEYIYVNANAIKKPTTLYANFKVETLSQIPYLQGGGVRISHYQKDISSKERTKKIVEIKR